MSDGSNLPALIDRACQRLAAARNSGEVLEAKAIAETAFHYARITKAANETHADCLRMIVRAEIRMADEIDAGRERGDLARQGQDRDNVRTPDVSILADLGVTKQRVAEWRDVRDAGMGIVETAIDAALLDGRAPTKADVQRAVQGKPHVSQNSGENEWYTPAPLIEAARLAMGSIDLDPASSVVANRIVKADVFYTVEHDGLSQPWRGNVWMNPPYAQPLIAQFCDSVSARYEAGEILRACVLVNNATETAWFQRMLAPASALCLLQGRVRFLDPGGEASGAPLQGQVVLYMGEDVERFTNPFCLFGPILEVVS